jgi:hypothetical protein
LGASLLSSFAHSAFSSLTVMFFKAASLASTCLLSSTCIIVLHSGLVPGDD